MPYQEEVLTDIKSDFSNPELQHLYDLQDKLLADSLFPFLQHRDPTFRYAVLTGFASMKVPGVVDSLAPLLNDPVDEVRIAAAYAIGQIGNGENVDYLRRAFVNDDTIGVHHEFNKTILEAIGKIGSPEYLGLISSVSTYRLKDTMLLEGQALGILRFALRNVVKPEGTSKMVTWVSDTLYPKSVRLIASNYFVHAPGLFIDSVAGINLPRVFALERDKDIKMAMALALGAYRTKNALDTLIYSFHQENDFRVKCNILRAFHKFDYQDVQETVLKAIKDPNPQVSYCAAEYLFQSGTPADATFYWRLAKDTVTWPVQMKLYAAANRHLPAYFIDYKNTINYELRQKFLRTSSLHEKAAALEAMAEFPWNYRLIAELGLKDTSSAVRSRAVKSLGIVSSHPDYDKVIGLSARRAKKELAAIFIQSLKSGDIGMMTEASKVLRDPAAKFKGVVDSLQFVDSLIAQCNKPQDIEICNELRLLKSYISGKPDTLPYPAHNHPINWSVLAKHSIDPLVFIHTGKGIIQVKLFKNLAPAAVTNFLQLIDAGFYSGKYFHSVVPAYLTQGGCNRGDGYGNIGYTIRSELPQLHYDKGYLGLVSSGLHTGNTQFFITQSPAFDLEGMYTIFGRVDRGMEYVYALQPGDRIEKIVLSN